MYMQDFRSRREDQSIVHIRFAMLSWISIALLLTRATAMPKSARNYVVHEERHIPPGWIKSSHQNVDWEKSIPMRIALKQQNLDRADEYIQAVSDPLSPLYAQHWDLRKIAEIFAPSDTTVQVIWDWLVEAGIDPACISRSSDGGWYDFNATIQEAKELLKTNYYVYENTMTGDIKIACDRYHVPQLVHQHLDFISSTVELTEKNSGRSLAASKGSQRKGQHSYTRPHLAGTLTLPNHLSNCSQAITPNCLRALYGFPKGSMSNPNNSFGVVEFYPGEYAQSDLDLYFSIFDESLIGHSPKLNPIDGGTAGYPPGGADSESDLDLEIAMGLVSPLNVTLFQIGNGYDPDAFLAAIDSSYCTNGASTNGTDCGTFHPTNVISLSFNSGEYLTPEASARRQCYEYMKLGLRGVTILVASGDLGVGQPIADGVEQLQCLSGTGYNTTFQPGFPASCPYVTTVGGTQVPTNSTIFIPEVAASGEFLSGGGFSNYFPMPFYQERTVLNWFDQYPSGYGPRVFNDSRNARGFPDISGNGMRYVYVNQGSISLQSGTSASVGYIFSHALHII